MSEITKKSIEHLAGLARIELSDKEEDRFLRDLDKILHHFKELEELNTDNVSPMPGGTDLENIFREDEEINSGESDEVKSDFPEEKNGFLKVPPVFE